MDIMLDLETMSGRSSAAIASIGAVAFDPKVQDSPASILNDVRRFFYAVVDLKSEPDKLFSYDGGTIYWWLQQSQRAREAIIPADDVPAVPIWDALSRFADFYNANEGGNTYSYGGNFDHPILQHAYEVMKMPNPISYSDQLCMRTPVKLSGISSPDLGLTAHKSLDDAIRQTIWLQQIFYKMSFGG